MTLEIRKDNKIDFESIREDSSKRSNSINEEIPAWRALLAGAAAGVSVDVSLYPIDTLKTRLQSPHGFWKSGGFKGVYRGLSAAASGSAPGLIILFYFIYPCTQKNNIL